MFLLLSKRFIIGIIIGLAVGLWFGVNIGRDEPLYANPFAEKTLSDAAKEKADALIKDTSEALRDKLDQ